jgi:hypothetical protein
VIAALESVTALSPEQQRQGLAPVWPGTVRNMQV